MFVLEGLWARYVLKMWHKATSKNIWGLHLTANFSPQCCKIYLERDKVSNICYEKREMQNFISKYPRSREKRWIYMLLRKNTYVKAYTAAKCGCRTIVLQSLQNVAFIRRSIILQPPTINWFINMFFKTLFCKLNYFGNKLIKVWYITNVYYRITFLVLQKYL